tara:strand:- start:1625 stop:2626 length:1002 start_codon:yes stop_codon:yes gene_type:complete
MINEEQQQEIDDLKSQLDESPEDKSAPVETENADPKPEEPTPLNGADKESKIIEEDGEVFIEVQKEGTESEPQGEPETEKPAEEPELKTAEEDTPMHGGKSREELLEMLLNAQQKIGEQGNELGNLRHTVQNIKPEDISSEQMLETLTSEDLEAGLAIEREKLLEIDPYETDELASQRALIADIENDLLNKKTEQALDDRFNAEDNANMIEAQREAFRQEGIDLTDEEYSVVTENALNYHSNGRLSPDSFHKGLIDTYGVEKVASFYHLRGQEKVREEIAKAESKTYPKVDVAGSGKNAKLVNIKNLSPKELDKTLDGLSIEELNALSKKINR